MDSTQLNLDTVEKLCQENFYIAFYQRGYRWREEQIRQLLDDLRDFQPTDEVPSYFLQVLIRSPRCVENGKTLQWNIVDGQQRLTTIRLILQEFGSDLRIEYDRNNSSLDGYFIDNAKNTIKGWFQDNGAVRLQVFDTLKKAFFLLYDLPFISDKTKREKAESCCFSDVNDGKISARDSELVKCVFLTPQKDEPMELTKRRAVEWDEMERALQDDDFYAFLTSRKAPDQDDRMTRLFLSAGLVPSEDDRKNATFPYLAVFQRECPTFASRHEIWERIAHSFALFRSWYRDNAMFHAIGWYLHQNDDGINNFTFENVKKSIADIVEKLEAKKKDENLYYSDSNFAKRILFLFNCAYAWRTAHMRYDFRRHKQVDIWSLEHIRATNIKPQDRETFETYVLACRKGKLDDFTYENYEKASEDGKGEDFLSDHLGENEYPRNADNSLGNLASLPKESNSSLNNKLFRDKREEVLKWYLGPNPDYFIPPATAAIFAKLFPGMEKEKPHLSSQDKEQYLSFMTETIRLFNEEISNVY